MKNKKGFTLVELLAVIAILAILVIIALPNVLKLFRSAKQNTFVTEVQNLVRSAENKYLTSSLSSGSNEICFDSKTNKLDMTGRDNLTYKIKLTNKGKIIEVNVRDDSYELIASEEAGINRVDLGNKYKVESAKTSITDCDGNELIDGEKPKVKYVETELNGADPVLGEKMIPVMLSDTGVATYAHDYDKWYSYKDKEWANAVILVDTPSKEYVAGDTIAESDIRGYFVWIPKYSYRIFNLGDYDSVESSQPEKSSAQQIEIEFGIRTTGEIEGECITPMESGLLRAQGATKDCQVGDLMTHPAFLSIPSNGFWVGKFETGYNQNEDPSLPMTDENISTWTTAKAQVNEIKTDNIIIKPNVYSWRGVKLYNFFMSAYNFNRNLDSHMMKNTEWGAVAYLSHSKYGIEDEVRINNNSNYLTGYAANEKDASRSETENTKWNTSNGYTASTTGNITGVYDMSGGSWEYVAMYIDGNNVGSSGMESIISNEIYNKYLDKYSNLVTSNTFYKYRILGDATGELGPFYKDGNNIKSTWYADFSRFVEPNYPLFGRGGGFGESNYSGQFYFNRGTGGAYSNDSARMVLNP